MVDLIAKPAAAGLLPLDIVGLKLTETADQMLTALAPLKGKSKALGEALKAAHGMVLPAANRATGKEGARALWFGHAHILLLGPPPDKSLGKYAAMTEQSDAWTVLRLSGQGAADVLARLTPIDLRPSQFKRGHTARTQVQHMMASITRINATTFQIMVFRSMAKTLLHDLEKAMAGVVSRG